MFRQQHLGLNNANNDVLTSCENYLTKMMKNKKVERPRTDQRAVRDKSLGPNGNQVIVSRPLPKPAAAPAKVEESRPNPSTQELLHKEIYNDNMATVEVTVRTVAQKGSRPKTSVPERREPWGKILLNRKSEETIPGSFVNFDPLRTLHFLSKELQLKLQMLCPADPSVQQIVHDMQNAIQRLPPDVVSQFKLSETNVFKNSCDGDSEIPVFKKEKREPKLSRQTQTVIVGDSETRKMQILLEESAVKLESSCKEMEVACNKLRNERDELQLQLQSEKETVQALKKELDECVSEKEEQATKVLRKITADRDELMLQVKELQTELQSQTGPAASDLKALIQDMRDKQLHTEQENTAIRNELTIMKLEKDKMNVMLECRDKQLRELRNELESIQTLVSNQLIEAQTKSALSPASSLSSVSQVWNVPSTKSKLGKSIHDIFLNNGQMFGKNLDQGISSTSTFTNLDDALKLEPPKFDVLQEIPQRENQTDTKIAASQGTLSSQQGYSPKISHTSIKDMFAEIKKQAFMNLDVSLPAPPRPAKNATPPESPNSESS